MNLYHVKQPGRISYDQYSDMVCVAESEEQAVLIHPRKVGNFDLPLKFWERRGIWAESEEDEWGDNGWCRPQDLSVRMIGTTETEEAGTVICASYHAG